MAVRLRRLPFVLPKFEMGIWMDLEYRSLCCHVSIAVTVMCTAEITAILLSYFTNLEHPLMLCNSYNVSVVEPFSSERRLMEHRLCTTSGPLLAYIIWHLFSDIFALIAIQTTKYRILLPFLLTTVLDVLSSGAYICVLIAQTILGDPLEKPLFIFVVAILVFKTYELLCSRRLYWYVQLQYDSRFTPRSTVVRDVDQFQF